MDKMMSGRLLLTLTLFLYLSGSALAEQGVVVGGPIGATDLGNAYLPGKSGFYIGLTNYLGWTTRLYNNRGDAGSGSSGANIDAAYLQYVYPFKLLSGTVSSGVQIGYQDVGHVLIPSAAEPHQADKGWNDLYVDFLNWSEYVGPLFGEHVPPVGPQQPEPYGLTVKAEYSMIFPTGHYSVNATASPGNGTLFFIPNFAATYLTPPDILGGGIEFDAHIFFDVRNTNPFDDYVNGDVVDIDYAVGQRLGNWTVGVTGYYTFQLQNDYSGSVGHRSIVYPKGDHLELFSVGPIASVYLPSLQANLKVKAPIGVLARNTLKVNGLIADLFFPF